MKRRWQRREPEIGEDERLPVLDAETLEYVLLRLRENQEAWNRMDEMGYRAITGAVDLVEVLLNKALERR